MQIFYILLNLIAITFILLHHNNLNFNTYIQFKKLIYIVILELNYL